MTLPLAALLSLLPRPRPFPLDLGQVGLLAGTALALAALFALLRAALLHSVPSRVLDSTRKEARKQRLRPLLERAESLASSASVYGITFQILFVVFVWVLVGEVLVGEGLSPSSMGLSVLITVPLLVFVVELLPAALRGPRSDRLLAWTLPSFELLQRPLAALVTALEAARGLVLRILRIRERPASTRQIVEGLRAVIEDSEREQDLAESERAIIENALGFHDVNVSEVMTPRTKMCAVEIEDGIEEIVRQMGATGHTRIPVYDTTLDRILGVAYAQEVLAAVARGDLERTTLQALLRPVLNVPATRLASELLGEFRRKRQKIAVVLDEYGGTAGLVTVGDLVTELVGEMPAELGTPEPRAIARQADGSYEVLGTTHVSLVNQELGLTLPEEEDFDTLAGFVLARFGRFPRRGERFEHEGVAFVVTEASDRRVIKVEVRPPALGVGPQEAR